MVKQFYLTRSWGLNKAKLIGDVRASYLQIPQKPTRKQFGSLVKFMEPIEIDSLQAVVIEKARSIVKMCLCCV